MKNNNPKEGNKKDEKPVAFDEASKKERIAKRMARAGPVSYTHLTLPTICSV